MLAGTAFSVEIAAIIVLTILIVVIVAVRSACDGAEASCTPVADVELALGDASTLTTYGEMAARARDDGRAVGQERCAICLDEYGGKAGELVQVMPACGHFFHAHCGVDRWLRERPTCPVCRRHALPLPRLPRPECLPKPAWRP